MMKEYDEILDKILKYDIITIYRHIKPDGDAVGSQLGFKTWINDNFPNKEVYVMGNDKFDIYPVLDKVKDDIIKKSLAIVLDSSDIGRVDDQRYKLSEYIIKIDHHPFGDKYGKINFIQEKDAAVCEILTKMFKEFEKKKYIFSTQCAEYLYSGLLTDTLSFRTTNVTKQTLESGSYLVSKNISPSALSLRMFSKSYKSFRLANFIRSKVKYRNGLAYIILNKKQLETLKTTSMIARNQVSELGSVKEFEVWAIFTQEENDLYQGTLRSKEIAVNNIALKYNGGGHKNAAGVNNLTKNDLTNIISDLKNEIKNKNNNISLK